MKESVSFAAHSSRKFYDYHGWEHGSRQVDAALKC